MESRRLQFDQRMAVPMFWISSLFLLFLAGFLHEAKMLDEGVENFSSPMEHFWHVWQTPIVFYSRWGMMLLWPLFIMEAVVHYRLKSPRWKKGVINSIFPPARIGSPDFQDGKTVWLPFMGHQPINEHLVDKVSKGATVPMILIALMVLPLLGVEHVWKGQIASHPVWSTLLRIGEGFIWFAFTFEFIVMLHIVEKKFQYCKTHWLDIAIILLPVLGFLRILRLGRLFQLSSRIPQLTRMMQLYNMRGLIMRLWRAVLVFNLLDRLLRGSPEKELMRCQVMYKEKEAELATLLERISTLEQNIQKTITVEEPVAEKKLASADSPPHESDANSLRAA